jgi:hypothetical protein
VTSAQRLRLVVALGTVNIFLVSVVLGFELTGALPSELASAPAGTPPPIADIARPAPDAVEGSTPTSRPAGPTTNPGVIETPSETPSNSPEVPASPSVVPEPTPSPSDGAAPVVAIVVGDTQTPPVSAPDGPAPTTPAAPATPAEGPPSTHPTPPVVAQQPPVASPCGKDAKAAGIKKPPPCPHVKPTKPPKPPRTHKSPKPKVPKPEPVKPHKVEPKPAEAKPAESKPPKKEADGPTASASVDPRHDGPVGQPATAGTPATTPKPAKRLRGGPRAR